MANMRTTYAASATITAIQLMPTHMTARQATCMPMNGTMRVHSIASASVWPARARAMARRCSLSSHLGIRIH